MSPQMNRNKLEIACIFYDRWIVFLPCLTRPSFFHSLTLSLGQQMCWVLVMNQFRPMPWLSLGPRVTSNIPHLGEPGESRAEPSLAFLVCRPARPSTLLTFPESLGEGRFTVVVCGVLRRMETQGLPVPCGLCCCTRRRERGAERRKGQG